MTAHLAVSRLVAELRLSGVPCEGPFTQEQAEALARLAYRRGVEDAKRANTHRCTHRRAA